MLENLEKSITGKTCKHSLFSDNEHCVNCQDYNRCPYDSFVPMERTSIPINQGRLAYLSYVRNGRF